MMITFTNFKSAILLLCVRLARGQSESESATIDPVTSVITADGGNITEIFTPTAISVSGLTPPITAATTITSTNTAGEEQLVAIAAGAGVVAGAGVEAWVYNPVPGGPPAPTSPPPYSTSPQADPEDATTPLSQPTTFTTITSSSSQPPACPFPSNGPSVTFAQAAEQPQWAVEISTQTVSSFAPKCTQQGENNQLLRGTTPEYITSLAEVFCQKDLSTDQTATLGQDDLSKSGPDTVKVEFGFEHRLTDDGCAQNCIDSFKQISLTCQYNSHVLYGGGSLEQGCGIYSLRVDAEPNTELECPPTPSPIYQSYIYRDAAVDAIDSFCGAQDGNTIVQGDDSTDIHENLFSVTYADDCKGSGTYAIQKDTCKSYLMQTLDSCDVDSTMFKHGGTLTDTDNCGAFIMHPTGKDFTACYPENEQFITGGSHAVVSPKIAQDAISQFCDLSGGGQSYTLDPSVEPQSGFSQNSCTSEGEAACSYFYTTDGDRVTKEGEVGDVIVRLTARYFTDAEAVNYDCPPREQYEIHGDRCHQMLGKLIGIEPEGQCAADPNKLELGSFLEVGDKGCVLWNMWATATHL